MCAQYITHLFGISGDTLVPQNSSSRPVPPLDRFIAYVFRRTRLDTPVIFAAMYLLRRLRERFPTAKNCSGHRMVIPSLMLSSKTICDDNYSNESWCNATERLFELRELNQMEREMCRYLEWQLNVDAKALEDFKQEICTAFSGFSPYPSIQIPRPVPSPFADPRATWFAPHHLHDLPCIYHLTRPTASLNCTITPQILPRPYIESSPRGSGALAHTITCVIDHLTTMSLSDNAIIASLPNDDVEHISKDVPTPMSPYSVTLPPPLSELSLPYAEARRTDW